MLRKLHLTISISLFAFTVSFAQSGALKVTLKDSKSGETIPFAAIVVEVGGSQVASGQTDLDGEAMIKPLPPGRANVKASLLGYQPLEITNVEIGDNKTAYLIMKMQSSVTEIKEYVKVAYVKPLIDPDTKVGATVTREEYKHMASRNINNVVATTAGVYQRSEGESVSIRGGRNSSGQDENSTKTFVDGQRVVGSASVPQNSVEQISVITGGIPAQFGDATAGIVNITTRGPQSKYFGGIEMSSSQLTDAYKYNYLSLSAGGPILSKTDTITGSKKAILGFIISGDALNNKDNDPSAIGNWKVKDDVLSELETNPLRKNPDNSTGTLKNSEFITKNDLERIKAKENATLNKITISGKLDFKPTNNFDFILGGSFDKSRQNAYSYSRSLFNPTRFSEQNFQTYRVFGRITQKFGNNDKESKDSKSSSVIRNAFYTLQAGYTRYNTKTQDPKHKDKLFDYGYLGKYTTTISPIYGSLDTSGNFIQSGLNYGVTAFDGSVSANPLETNYTQQYIDVVGINGQSSGDITAGGGLLNGGSPDRVYALWSNTGTVTSNKSKFDQSQFRVNADFSADIKNHAIQLGFEYEQRNESFYSVAPVGLWSLMRQLANKHISGLDKTIDIDTVTSFGQPAINHPRFYSEADQSYFDKNLRKKLGYAENSLDWIDIDNISPDKYSIDLFSADELLNSGSSLVNYYGYDYKGNKLKNKPAFKDFFTKQDGAGNNTRDIGSFQPIYMAGYIQDKFDFRDLKFQIGVRVDRFDANQKVLKDQYSFFETYKAGDVKEIKGKAISHPANIGNNYVVYVDNITNPTKIVGYRDKDKWYGTDGSEVADPQIFEDAAGGKSVAPYLVDPSLASSNAIKGKNFDPSKSFVDYTPQINFMPRIAFSFPISDVANFFAHYDVLTQRPPGNLRMNPLDYFFIESSGTIDNPNLKPERTTDYELGFSQVLSEASAITISGFYRELKNMIQVVNINKAYPKTYATYGNIDFGTVKGLSVAYDLRRTHNISLNANYTLQFADGSGSSASSGVNLVSSGLPNLRTSIPLDYDQRHSISLIFDYRFSSGTAYDGPNWFKKQIFANTGANLTMRAGSGAPYSEQSNVSQGDVDLQNTTIGVSQTARLKGSINGSRLPWSYRMDLRVDRQIDVHFGKGDDENRKEASLNVYVQVLNLLDTKNVLRVYRYTGSASDDGYLASPIYQDNINAQTNVASYKDLYSVKANNPSNYSVPRRIRIGVELSF